MNTIEAVLKKSAGLEYVVRGGRSYLAKIPTKYLKTLAVVLPEFFTVATSDWNIHVLNNTDYLEMVKRVEAAFAGTGAVLRQVITPKMIRMDIEDKGGHRLGWIANSAKSKGGHLNPHCDTAILVANKIKYSSFCNCFSQMKYALESKDFGKALQTRIRMRVLINLHKEDAVNSSYSKVLMSVLKMAI
jgi:hypothetical protein